MKLYHGSNVTVQKPRLFPSVRALDFGNGFYLTSDYAQASKWAVLTVKRRGQGVPKVSLFEVKKADMDLLNVLRFPSVNIEWLKYISSNRKKGYFRRD